MVATNTRNMKNIENLEIIQINTTDGKLYATLSYQNLDNIDNINNGYSILAIPINIRELQLSASGNVLVDQSVKSDVIAETQQL